MRQSASDTDVAVTRARLAVVADTLRSQGLVAALVFALTTPLAFVWVRLTWQGLLRTLRTPEVAEQVAVIAYSPYSILATQGALATAIGLVLGLEHLVYGTRRRILPNAWLTRRPLAHRVRRLLVLVGAGLFPVGMVLGQRYVTPIAADLFVASVSVSSFVRAAGILGIVTILSGLALQVTFALGVVVLNHVRSPL